MNEPQAPSDLPPCEYCGGTLTHTGKWCQRVKGVEFFSDGETIKRIEFFSPGELVVVGAQKTPYSDRQALARARLSPQHPEGTLV